VPDFSIETALKDTGHEWVAGVDECGRGVLAGDVTAAAVVMNPSMVDIFKGILKDSKKLSHKKRLELRDLIVATCDFSICSLSNSIVDEINILEATKLAMKIALDDLKVCDFAIIDGNMKFTDLRMPYQSVVKGDDRSLSIAAASIIAKVHRDLEMIKLDKKYPMYGFGKHKGYGTKMHREAIVKYGPCDIHRTTFKGVKEYV
jgi:ribonuclease HII